MLALASLTLVTASYSTVESFVPGELLVKYETGISRAAQRTALAVVAGQVKEQILTAAMKSAGEKDGWYLVQVKGDVLKAVAELEATPGVASAEPNFVWTNGRTIVNDPYFLSGQLWGMQGLSAKPINQYGVDAYTPWSSKHYGSRSVHVGVIDEGIMFTHPDLAGNCWLNPYDPIDGIDNDGNGYIDDTRGWDFVSNNNSVYDGVGDDHATHCAGTIGALANNSIGVVGVCQEVTMISCKFLGSSGGTTANAIKAFDYLTDLKTRHGIDLVASNNSWGGGGFSQALVDAITRHGNANILAIVAAGNSNRNMDTNPSYPASYTNSNIVSVASITSTGARSSFSNYGLTTTDLGAPGSGIFSTVPTSSGPGYASYNGTSMATPHVTGGAALWAARNPERGLSLKAKLLTTVKPTPSLSGLCVTGGRLNVSSY